MQADRKVKRMYLKYGRKLLCSALQGYYFFEDDSVENKIVQAQKKYNNTSETPETNGVVRDWVMSHPEIRDKICKVGYEMYSSEAKTQPNQFEKYMLNQ